MSIAFTLRPLTILIFTVFVFCALVLPSWSQSLVSSNETSPSDLDQLYAQNVLNLVADYKRQVRERLWRAFNRSQILFESNLANRSLENGCFDLIRSALELPTNSTQFEWLVQMYDSSGSTPNGILSGTTTSLGDFDQCLRVGEKDYFEETQYCLLTLRIRRSEKYSSFHFNQLQSSAISQWEQEHIDKLLVTDNRVPIVVGLCLPAQCTSPELSQISRSSSSLVQYFDSDVQYCQTRSQDGRLIKLIPFLFVIGILNVLSGLGSFLDFLAETQFGKDWSEQFNCFPVNFLRCFSAIHNTRLLFNVKSRHDKQSSSISNGRNQKPKLRGHPPTMQSKSHISMDDYGQPPVQLDILDGIRVFAIFWIIVSHCASFTQVPHNMKVSPLAHYPEDMQRSKNENWFISVYLLGTYYAVSIFFMISGILLMFNRKRNVHCSAKFHFIQHFVNRVLRLLPTLLATMGISYYLRYLGTGPLYHQKLIDPYVEPCRTHFWYHLFMVHNYLSLDQRCGSHTWYVGADFQLQIVAFFVIHIARCRSKWFTGLIVTIGIIAFSSFIPLFLVTLGIGQLPNFDAYVDPRISFPQLDLKLFYYSAHNHAPAFFIGVLLGYILSSGWDFSFVTKNKLMRFSIFQLSSITIILVPPAMRYFVYSPDLLDTDPRSPLFIILLFQFLSYAFNLAIAGFIFILALNPKMYIAEYLSSKSLRPIARLVFCAYLSHQMLIWFFLQQSRSPFFVNFTSLFFFTSMIFATTTIFSIYLYLMIECPFIRISKLIFSNQSIGNNKPSISRLDGHLMMRSISTAESYAQRMSSIKQTHENENPDESPNCELQSIIIRQPVSHFTDSDTFNRPIEDHSNRTDQNNNNNNFATPNGNSLLASNNAN